MSHYYENIYVSFHELSLLLHRWRPERAHEIPVDGRREMVRIPRLHIKLRKQDGEELYEMDIYTLLVEDMEVLMPILAPFFRRAFHIQIDPLPDSLPDYTSDFLQTLYIQHAEDVDWLVTDMQRFKRLEYVNLSHDSDVPIMLPTIQGLCYALRLCKTIVRFNIEGRIFCRMTQDLIDEYIDMVRAHPTLELVSFQYVKVNGLQVDDFNDRMNALYDEIHEEKTRKRTELHKAKVATRTLVLASRPSVFANRNIVASLPSDIIRKIYLMLSNLEVVNPPRFAPLPFGLQDLNFWLNDDDEEEEE